MLVCLARHRSRPNRRLMTPRERGREVGKKPEVSDCGVKYGALISPPARISPNESFSYRHAMRMGRAISCRRIAGMCLTPAAQLEVKEELFALKNGGVVNNFRLVEKGGRWQPGDKNRTGRELEGF